MALNELRVKCSIFIDARALKSLTSDTGSQVNFIELLLLFSFKNDVYLIFLSYIFHDHKP